MGIRSLPFIRFGGQTVNCHFVQILLLLREGFRIATLGKLTHHSAMPPAPSSSGATAAGTPPALSIRAIAPNELDLLARVRGRCYDASYARAKRHQESLAAEGRWGDAAEGDFLIAERNGRPAGTITALRGVMSVRGVTLPCQGIAWVGTTHDARRTAGGGGARGAARAPGVGADGAAGAAPASAHACSPVKPAALRLVETHGPVPPPGA